MIAYCFASGHIRFGQIVPPGAIEIARGRADELREQITATARLAYDGETLLVPGVPEASDDDEKALALNRYLSWLADGSQGITINQSKESKPMHAHAITPSATKGLAVESPAPSRVSDLLERINSPDAVTELALAIADDSSRADIECSCAEVATADGFRWYDTEEVADEDDRKFVALAVHYLTLRGRLVFSAASSSIVTFAGGDWS
ncbi:hypothetical protein [Lysobacter sp. CA199]|uniref:hypothetical protein n=1 Tax=Lysobacter sp. CA199 TaxID=3455608 RepID=UPI003F8D7CD8